MKYYFILILIFTQGVNAGHTPSKKNMGAKHTAIYVIKYYYPEEPGKILFTRVYGRRVNKNGSFCLIDYKMDDRNKVSYNSCYDKNGMPTEFGSDKDLIKIYKDSVCLNFKGKDTTLLINTAMELKDSTALWFWKRMPKVNETVTVGGIRKNFITKKIDLVRVAFTYLGEEKIIVLGNIKTCYLVKSVPLNGSKDVYDERWFDKQGMLVREKHVVGKNGFRMGELSEMISQ